MLLAVFKFVFCALSGGFAFRSFVEANHATPSGKIASIIVFVVSMAFIAPDVMSFFTKDDIETERVYWASVEKTSERTEVSCLFGKIS